MLFLSWLSRSTIGVLRLKVTRWNWNLLIDWFWIYLLISFVFLGVIICRYLVYILISYPCVICPVMCLWWWRLWWWCCRLLHLLILLNGSSGVNYCFLDLVKWLVWSFSLVVDVAVHYPKLWDWMCGSLDIYYVIRLLVKWIWVKVLKCMIKLYQVL